jgi:hypothetical protein
VGGRDARRDPRRSRIRRAIARQVRRWQFGFPTRADRTRHDAVRAAATFLDEHADLLPDGAVPTNATQRAVLAIELHDAFLERNDATGETTVVDPDPDVVRVELTSRARGASAP